MGACCCVGEPETFPRPIPPGIVVGPPGSCSGGMTATINAANSFGGSIGTITLPWGTSSGWIEYNWGYSFARVSYFLEVEGEYPWDGNLQLLPDPQSAARLRVNYEIEAAPAFETGEFIAWEGKPTLYTDEFYGYEYIAQVTVPIEINCTYPCRDVARIDITGPGYTAGNDAAEYHGRKEAKLSKYAWPDDLPEIHAQTQIIVMGTSKQVEATAPGTGQSIRNFGWTAPALMSYAGAGMSNALFGGDYDEQNNIRQTVQIAAVSGMTAFGASPGITEQTRDTTYKRFTAGAGAFSHSVIGGQPLTFDHTFSTSVSFAPAFSVPVSVSLKTAGGEAFPSTVKALSPANGPEITVFQGEGSDTYLAKNYRLSHDGFAVEDHRHRPKFEHNLDGADLQLGGWSYNYRRVPLQLPYSWASWDAVQITRKTSHAVDAGTDASLWTADGGASVSVVGGKLQVITSGATQTISRVIDSTQTYMSTARFLRFLLSCNTGGGVVQLEIGTKTYQATLAGTSEETHVLDLCAPANLSAVDAAYHSRYKVELDRQQGGWGYGADNAPTRFITHEWGNKNAGWPLTITLRFSQAATWTVGAITMLPGQYAIGGYADMIADVAAYQVGTAGLMPDGQSLDWSKSDFEIYARRGMWAMDGRIVLDELTGVGYNHPLRGREAIADWIGQMVVRHRSRAADKGLYTLESLTPWQSVLLPNYPHVPQEQRLQRDATGQPAGTEYYSTVEQYNCDWQDAHHLSPVQAQFAATLPVSAYLWADNVEYGEGVSGSLSATRWIGGNTAGLVCEPGAGIPARTVQAISTRETKYSVTNPEGFYRHGGLRNESYNVGTGIYTIAQVPEVWLRICFPEDV